MTEMQIFEHPQFGYIRAAEIDGEPWLVGKDVAVALGYTDTKHAVIDHVDEEDRVNSKTQGQNDPELGQRGAWLINESGLYSLILYSKLPGAKKFKRWVTSEVLPSIRKHGGYLTPETIDRIIRCPRHYHPAGHGAERRTEETQGAGGGKRNSAPIVHSDGTPDARMFTKWTQKGRLLIHEILTKRGIKAQRSCVNISYGRSFNRLHSEVKIWQNN